MLLILGLGSVAFSLFGSMFYDLQKIRIKKKEQAHPHASALRARPVVSIVIQASQSMMELDKCLTSIAQNSYRKCEIIVINRGSVYQVKKQIKIFEQHYPSRKIKLLNSRKQSLQKIIKKNTTGQLVLLLDSNFMLAKYTLHKCVRYFALNPDYNALKLDFRSIQNYSILGLQRQFEESLASQWAKFKSVARRQKNGGHGCIYRTSAFDAPNTKIRFCSDAILYSSPSLSYLSSLKRAGADNLIRQIRSALIFVLVTYFIYIALYHKYTVLLALIWTFGIYLLAFSLWSDEYLSVSKKLRLFMLTPMVCAIIYLLSIIKIFIRSNKLAFAEPVS